MLLLAGEAGTSEVSEKSLGARDASRALCRLALARGTGPGPRVIGRPPEPWRSSAVGILASVPWCCILPAGLASLGLASLVLAHWVRAAVPVLLAASVVFFMRAHYLLWAERHGSRSARFTTVLLTLVSAILWTLRLSSPAFLLDR